MPSERTSRRLAAFTVISVLLFALLLGRLWQMQVLQGHRFRQLSEENRLRDLRLPAPRGILYDRRGRPLVTNRAAFTVSLLPMELRSPQQVLPRLAAILEVTPAEIQQRLQQARRRPFEPVRLLRDAPKRVVAMVEENRLDLPGVIIEVEPVRHYLYGSLAAHALGHLGEIDAAELASPAWEGYRMGDLIGKAGVERSYDRELRGHDGRLRVEVDARGWALGILGRDPAHPGRSLVLTIDLDIQKAAEAALGEMVGAVVVLDARNGEVLAMASHPTFDPNAFAAGISPQAWARLAADRSLPLLSRAVDSTYEPGSVFKVVTAAAALARGTATRATRVTCNGTFRLGGWVFRDLKAHGTVNFIEGVAQSCNVFFWTLGTRTGGEAMAEMARALGLGERTGIDLPSESPGLIPDSHWKQRTQGEPWYPGDNANMAIGQGWVNVTPLQVARMIAAIGNGGTLVRPHLVRQVLDADGRPSRSLTVPPAGRVAFRPDVLATLQEALAAVVQRGTGRGVAIPGLSVAGKTGSAENPRGRPHAWFAAYAPAENPRVAVAVLVEHGRRGGLVAAPVARAVLQAAFGISGVPQARGGPP
ncbi:MAG: penicillin-binding protein 2 [Armatimonadota bacterium]|nr:penicillin-binding protein 2 [Armatimonadota bacterium]MDR7474867.1 penicillin-binding protein 2 [Armatimonadota bacterium]